MMSPAPKPLESCRLSSEPFVLKASRRELPVVRSPPAESEAVVPSIGRSHFGSSPGALGASTRTFASGGGAPRGGGGVVACAAALTLKKTVVEVSKVLSRILMRSRTMYGAPHQ